MSKTTYVLRKSVTNITVNILDIKNQKVLDIPTNNDRRKEMKHLTAKQASITVTIKTEGNIESYFFYDMAQYSEIINAINESQFKAGL